MSYAYSGDYGCFERLYARTRDPWGQRTSANGRRRYTRLLEVIESHAPASILDVGCGEGDFTRRLVAPGREVVGIDVSETAIGRARQVSGVTYACCPLEAFAPRRVFDLVIAVEMLYYMPLIEEALSRLRALGRNVIITYSSRARARIEPYLATHEAGAHSVFVSFPPFRRRGFTVVTLAGATAR